MLKPLLAALALVMALASPAMAQTQRYQLTDQAWVDLGATPLTVRTLGNPALLVIDTTAPSALNAPATVLGSEAQTGLPVTVTGQHVYARALNGSTAVAVLPNPGAGGGGGGGGATTIADGADVAEGAKADAAATNGTGSWSVIAMLKGIYNSLLAPTPAGTNIIGKVGIDQTTPGTTNGVQVTNQSTQTTTGALQPPTATAGKITQTSVSLTANTSTSLVAANTARIAVEIQCDGTAPVGVDRTGGALTSATAAPLVIPSGAYPLYPMPIATLTAITAYTGTAQVCRVTEYNR